MAIANTKVFPKHFDRDISKIFFDDYASQQSYFDSIAKMFTPPVGNHYTEAELSPLGQLQLIQEGNPVNYDDPVEGNEKTVYFTKYGLGFQVTEEMMSDDIQRNFMSMPSKLAKSAAYKRETVYWDQFNNGFAGTSSAHKAWDGNNIWKNATHKELKTRGNISNRPGTDAALSETTLQAAFEYYDKLTDQAGMYIQCNPRYLVVPTELRWTAAKLLKNEGPYESADRNINTVRPDNMPESWSPMIVPHLTSSTAWWLVSDDHDHRFMWKDNIKMESADDFATGNALFKVTMRFAAETFNYVGSYGTSGA